MDDLIAQIRVRLADPKRRTEEQRSVFNESFRGLDIAGLMRGMAGVQADLDRAVAAVRSGRIDPDVHARANQIAAAMSTPVSRPLSPPADEAAIAAAETALGVALPPQLRRIYSEVADGGFGPGLGLLELSRVVGRYAELRAGDELPDKRTWPEGLLPVVDRDGELECVEASSGRVIDWDPEGLSRRSSEAVFGRSFRELAPSVEDWLAAWLARPTLGERMADGLKAAQVKAARESRARIAAMSPEERRAMGLPDEGWERVVWGGLGLEEDEPA
jgi:hypothetical protein